MATDKRLDQVSTLTDFDYALIVKGEQVSKVTKQQLAELVGNLLYGATTKETLASVVAGLTTPGFVFVNENLNRNALNLSSSASNLDYAKALFRYICKTYPNLSNKTFFISNASNSTAGTCRMHVYNTSEVSSDGIPRYASLEISDLNSLTYFMSYEWSITESRIDNFGYNSLAELSAGVASEILPNFKCGYVFGTSKDDNIQIAKDVIANTTQDCSFSVIHKYAGERHVYGYIYGGKTYGSLTIQKYQGQSIVVDIQNGEYSIRP